MSYRVPGSSSSSTTTSPSVLYGTAYASSVSRTSSPVAQHPLNVAPAITTSSLQAERAPSLAVGLAPPLSPNPGVRSRKSASSTPTQPSIPHFTDPDVTRPSLKRLNDTATAFPGQAQATSSSSSTSLTPSSPSRNSSLEEWARPRKSSHQEREIIVHELEKSDSIASISLRYGITPQALRSANRLWSSDSIHLRKTLNIPLDQCHLPSASTGIERIEREEDGNITVWQRRPLPSSSSSSSLSVAQHQTLSPSRSSSSLRESIISPRARRLQSASAFELGTSSLDSTGATADLIGIWSSSLQDADLPDQPHDGSTAGHGRNPTVHSVQDAKGKGRLIDDIPNGSADAPIDAVASYLPSTNNPYSLSNSPAPLLISPFATTPRSSTGDPFDRLEARASSAASSSAASSTTSPPPGHPPPLQKHTLTISRVPNSQLSFFPPSSNSSSARSSLSTDEDSRHPPRADQNDASSSSDLGFSSFGRSGKRRTRNGVGGNSNSTRPVDDVPGMSGTFFGPLAGSLARLGFGGGKAGTWSSSANSSTSSLGNGSAGGGSDATTPRLNGHSTMPASSSSSSSSSWARKWDLSYFGGEEEEAETAAAYFGSGGAIGLRDADSTWSRRRTPIASGGTSSSGGAGGAQRRKMTPPRTRSPEPVGISGGRSVNSSPGPARRPDVRDLFRDDVGSGETGIGKLV